MPSHHRFTSSLAIIASFLLAALVVEPSDAATREVSAGQNLQAAVDAAAPGDTLLLEAGATFMGPLWLRYKPGADESTAWITIRTSTPDGQFPLPGTRVTPAHAPLMARIVSNNMQPMIRTEFRAHHYRLIGLEISPTDANTPMRELVYLGDGSETQNRLELIPHHIDIARCYVHAFPTQDTVRGIALNSAYTNIEDSHVSEIHSVSFDSQAIWGWQGPGPFDIINNYLEAAGENVGFGGVNPAIQNMIPANIRILRNHLRKPMEWKASGKWMVKNLFELKFARDILVEGNVFENNWAHAQAGIAISIGVRTDGATPWSTIANVVFRNNIIRNAGGGIQILGRDDGAAASITGDNWVIENNLFINIDKKQFGGDGHMFKIGNVPTRLQIIHNTFHSLDGGIDSGCLILVYGTPATGFVFRDNFASGQSYGIYGVGTYMGTPSINQYFPGAIFVKNVVTGVDGANYPPGNFYPVHASFLPSFRNILNGDFGLVVDSPFRQAASDGSDIGASVARLNAALAGVKRPAPSAPRNVRIVP